jgi:hypothetical protein
MRWVLCVPQIIETADGMSKEQLVEQLVKQQILRGAADAFTLEPITELCGDDIKNDVGNDGSDFILSADQN